MSKPYEKRREGLTFTETLLGATGLGVLLYGALALWAAVGG